MEFPFGHHHHHHGGEDDLPPPEVSYVHHTSHVGGCDPYPPPFGYPPPPEIGYPQHSEPYGGLYPPPPPAVGQSEPYDGTYPPPSAVHHVSHESYHHRFQSDEPEVFHHESHPHHPELTDRPTVRVFCRAETNHSLSIRNGKVILARTDLSDPCQHWIKDEKYSTKVKDEQGLPSFALVNKVTGEAIKHSIGATHPVQLIAYNPNYLDESILWTESKEVEHGYRAIRMVNNIRLNMDAFHGDEDHGGVHDGTTIVLWEWTKGNNQQWKIIPY